MPVRIVTSTPFERWDPKTKENFVNDFASKYNQVHKTNFCIFPESLNDQDDFDFSLMDDSGSILKVQHTFAGAEEKEEYVDPKLQNILVSQIKEHFRDVRNIFLSFGFKKHLKNKEEVNKLSKNIIDFLTKIFEENKVQPTKELKLIFSHPDTDGPCFLREYFSDFEVFSNDSERFMFGYGGKTRAMLPDNIRTTMAVGHKEGHYSNPEDIILVVHHNIPIFDIFIEETKREFRESRFKGIWIFDAFTNRFIPVK